MNKTITRKFLFAILFATLIPSTLAVLLLFRLLGAHDSIVSGHLRSIVQNSSTIEESFKKLIIGKKNRFKAETELLSLKIDAILKKGSDPQKTISSFLKSSKEIAQISLFIKAPPKIINESIFTNPLTIKYKPDFSVKNQSLLKPDYKFVSFFLKSTPYNIKVTMSTSPQALNNYKKLATIYSQNSKIINIFKGLRKYYWLIFLVALFVITLLASIISGLILRNIAHKIGILAEAMNEVTSGNLQTKVTINGRDELSELGNDFNNMIIEMDKNQNKIRYLERMGAWQEVARNLAHEIKNPLTPILLAVQQIQEKVPEDNPEFKKLVIAATEIITEEINTLKRLVENFGNLARLPDKKVESIDISSFMDDLINLTNFTWSDTKISLRSRLPGKVFISGDKMLLKRALFNIIENGIQSMVDEDQENSSITITLYVKKSYLLITIEDIGSGIEDTDKIFNPYFTTKEGGTGLGLPLAKKIILDIGGTIIAENRKIKGAKITIKFPVT